MVQIGGQPQDAVVAGGSLWVSDYSGHVIRVDPASGRVMARIDVDGNPEGIAAGAGAVWVASPDAYEDGRGSLLSRIDPRTADVEHRLMRRAALVARPAQEASNSSSTARWMINLAPASPAPTYGAGAIYSTSETRPSMRPADAAVARLQRREGADRFGS